MLEGGDGAQGLGANELIHDASDTATHASSRGRTLKLGAAWGIAVVVAATLYVFAGLVGHDPWKQDEGYTLGIIRHMLASRDWVVPAVAGEPFMEKPPLYYYSAALSAWLFSRWLPLHDAARVASGFWMLLTLWLTWRTGELLNGARKGALTVAILCGSVGFIYNVHLLFTDVALLAGFAMGFYGLARIAMRMPNGGAWLGSGAGIGFMSKGVFAPGALGVTCLLLIGLSQCWRTGEARRQWLAAISWMLPWAIFWPTALYLRSSSLFTEWFWDNNIGRFFGFVDLGSSNEPFYYFKTLPWFAFPMLPLAAWTVWRERANGTRNAALQLGVASALVLLTILSVSATARALYALPALIPLSWLAARSAVALPRRWQTGLDYASRLFAWLFLGSWVLWSVMLAGGRVIDLPLLHGKLPQPFVFTFDARSFTIAALATVLYVAATAKLHQVAARATVSWVAALLLAWTLLTTIWLPWIDTAKSYRQPFTELAAVLPSPPPCLLTWAVGESERPMLEYFVHVSLKTYDPAVPANCDYMLEETMRRPSPRVGGAGWVLRWQGHRPGDDRELFSLYVRKRPSRSSGSRKSLKRAQPLKQ